MKKKTKILSPARKKCATEKITFLCCCFVFGERKICFPIEQVLSDNSFSKKNVFIIQVFVQLSQLIFPLKHLQ
jgi:hypothetical protein